MLTFEEQSWSFSRTTSVPGERVAGCLFRYGSVENKSRGQARQEPSSTSRPARPSVAGSSLFSVAPPLRAFKPM